MTGAHRLSTSPATPTATTSCSPRNVDLHCSQQIGGDDQRRNRDRQDKNGTTVTAQDTFTVAVVSPVVNKKICPIKGHPGEAEAEEGRQTGFWSRRSRPRSPVARSSSPWCCAGPLATTAAGEKAFCDTKVTKRGKIRVKTRGYDKVKVTVIVRSQAEEGLRRPVQAQHVAQVLDPQVSVTGLKGRTPPGCGPSAVPVLDQPTAVGSGWNGHVDARGCKWTMEHPSGERRLAVRGHPEGSRGTISSARPSVVSDGSP